MAVWRRGGADLSSADDGLAVQAFVLSVGNGPVAARHVAAGHVAVGHVTADLGATSIVFPDNDRKWHARLNLSGDAMRAASKCTHQD